LDLKSLSDICYGGLRNRLLFDDYWTREDLVNFNRYRHDRLGRFNRRRELS